MIEISISRDFWVTDLLALVKSEDLTLKQAMVIANGIELGGDHDCFSSWGVDYIVDVEKVDGSMNISMRKYSND